MSRRVKDLTAVSVLKGSDYFYIIEQANTANTPDLDREITVDKFFALIPSPANFSNTVTFGGSVFFGNNLWSQPDWNANTGLAQILNKPGSFVGDSGTGGTIGFVPPPAAGDAALQKFLRADGSWAVLPVLSSNNAIVQGAKGDTGAQGIPGIPGANGTTLRNGTGVPASNTGSVGDFYIDTLNSAIYGPKTSNTWGVSTSILGAQGPQGNTGPQGIAGNTVRSGNGSPSIAIGNIGDFYFDSGALVFYGPKSAGNWPISYKLANVAISGSYADLLNKPAFATVATTGSYGDLLNKPTSLSLGGATLGSNVLAANGSVLFQTSSNTYAAVIQNTLDNGTTNHGLNILIQDGGASTYFIRAQLTQGTPWPDRFYVNGQGDGFFNGRLALNGDRLTFNSNPGVGRIDLSGDAGGWGSRISQENYITVFNSRDGYSFQLIGNPAVTLNANGFVGIGTTTPGAPLVVQRDNALTTGTPLLQLISNYAAAGTNGYGGYISFLDLSGSEQGRISSLVTGGNRVGLAFYTGVFSSNTKTESMRIDGNGNVIIPNGTINVGVGAASAQFGNGFFALSTIGSNPRLAISPDASAFLVLRQDSTSAPLNLYAGQLIASNAGTLGFWGGTNFSVGAVDTAFSRTAAGTVALGNGAFGDTSGTLIASHFQTPSGSVLLNNVADQIISGGANITSAPLVAGNIAIDCGKCPLQFITNDGAFSITPPTNDGSAALLITNGATAGAITFTGFTAGAYTGEALTTIAGNMFILTIFRINGISTYTIKALQ